MNPGTMEQHALGLPTALQPIWYLHICARLASG